MQQQEYQQLTLGPDALADDMVYELADTSVYVPPVELPTPFNRIGLAVTRDDDDDDDYDDHDDHDHDDDMSRR